MTDEQKTNFLAKLLIGKKDGGTIRHWFVLNSSIYGTLVEEASEEYPEDHQIRTSKTVKIHTINNEQILETLNSYYRLIEESSITEYYTRSKDN